MKNINNRIGIFLIGILFSRKRRRLSSNITQEEGRILHDISNLQGQLNIAGLRDDIAASLTEMRILTELRKEYEAGGEANNLSEDELTYEIESINEAQQGIRERIERMKGELRMALKEDSSDE